MRISTNQIQTQAVNAMLDQQAKVSKTQSQISSGKRLVSAADDPLAAVRSAGLEQSIKLVDQYQRNGGMAQDRLAEIESVISEHSNILQRLRELVIQGNNASQSDESRALIAIEVKQLLSESLDLANTRNAAGEYLFSGTSSKTPAYSLMADGSFSYNGDQGQRYLQIGTDALIQVTESGADVFSRLKNGNGSFVTEITPGNTGSAWISTAEIADKSSFQLDEYSIQFTSGTSYDLVNDTTGAMIVSGASFLPGQSISFNGSVIRLSGQPLSGDSFVIKPSEQQDMFVLIKNIAELFEGTLSSATNSASKQNKTGQILQELSGAEDNLLNIRTKIGAQMNTIETQGDLNDSYSLQLQKTLSLIQDLDYAEATGRLNLQLTALEAAQQAFLRVQNLTLFNLM
jgi:flagellar hook-associated protein 3 FlgL